VIFCVFDSINHVRRFSDWKKVFALVRRHLSPGGCFILDINTQRKLERLIAGAPWLHRFGKNLLIMDVTALPNRRSNWNIKVFEHVAGSRYVLHEEDIVEVSFPLRQIVAAWRTYYVKVRVIDPDRNRPTAKSERVFLWATTHDHQSSLCSERVKQGYTCCRPFSQCSVKRSASLVSTWRNLLPIAFPYDVCHAPYGYPIGGGLWVNDQTSGKEPWR